MHTNTWQRRWECAPAAARIFARTASIWLAAGMLLIARESPAQQFTFRHYQQTEGLGNLSVTCLLQDRAGFIWMCTENGLFRHDGVDFERFGEKDGIDSTSIRSAVEDFSGTLWVGTAHELYLRDGPKFRAIRPEGRNLGLAPGFRLAAFALGQMLVIDADRLLELDATAAGATAANAAAADAKWHSKPFFTQQQLDATPALEHLSSVHVDRFGRIWLGCGSAICRVEHGEVAVFDAGSGVPEDTWRSWLVDRDGALWVRGQAHVAVLEATATRFETRDPPHGRLTAEILNVPLVQDREGRILTSSDDGLARWQGDWQTLTARNGIPNAGISAILVSRDGQVWLGSPGHGLQRWLGYGHFESWTMAQGLGANPVWSILRAADQSVLLATRAGCYRLDPAATLAAPCRLSGIPPGEIHVMAQSSGALWIGMTTGGLFRIGAEDQSAAWVADVPLMRKLYVDSANRLWICSSNGVYLVEPGATQVESMPLPMQVGEVTDVSEDAQGEIWLATQGGLLRWSAGRWIALGIEGERARGGFATVAAAAGGWLWAGGASHGMLHVHVDGDRADDTQWVPDLMLSRAAVKFTSIDSRGWVWAGTDAGVAVHDGRLWRQFNAEDGLIWNDTAQNGAFADADGSLWIGTRAGLTHIRSPEALMQITPIDLQISRASLGWQRFGAEPFSRPWEPDMALDLHLSQLSYGQVGQSYLRVRLRGLADDWFETRSHDMRFPALAPGHYTFEAIAIDPNHQQTSQMMHLSFDILPPWWRTTWFRLALAAAILGSLAMAWNWRRRKLNAQQQARERQRKEHAALVVRATRDALTGLWNRTAILDILAREIKSAKRHAKPLAIAIIDIDHFKRINDTYGHLAGDEVLRTLGAKLIGKVRASDSLGRYGGEEFLLVVPGAPSQSPFLPLERLHRAIAEIPVVHAGSAIKVTASFGVAWLIAGSDTAESLLSRADAALYTAKFAGRNRVEYAATG